ncbi:Hypothetical Protein FCC1311_091452 [Hondaea fermentalgiana]|uniref:Uncharacterized protein n=1 Tax=Hondaea fermentalgiana TaxID=2315210 RepID=A0A2R5GRI5_9STRA|nr:Hypothetical Protein FCC1311_091452 [Hondaea fermentalgiana]|eukprot:GBG32919.1 Hypothetical Protein FCC1311_091452 [Hondaea fermentalgiana]
MGEEARFVEQGGVQVRFELLQRWTNKYQRNNKRSGLKNLRCFPYCSEPHKDKGFCGNAVNMTVRRLPQGPRDPLFAWAEFRRTDIDRDIKVGTVVSTEKMTSGERHKGDPRLPYYRGEVGDGSDVDAADDEEEEKVAADRRRKDASSQEDAAELVKNRMQDVLHFSFNRRKRGWNYSWAANKHTGNATHALFVYIMVPHGADAFRCIAVVAGPSFLVLCRKRPSEDEDGGPARTTQLADDLGPTTQRKVAGTTPSPTIPPTSAMSSSYPSPIQSGASIASIASIASSGNDRRDHHSMRDRGFNMGSPLQASEPIHLQPPQEMHPIDFSASSNAPFVMTTGSISASGSETSLEHAQTEAAAAEAEADEFRRFFIDEFWQDEGLLNIDQFTSSTASTQKRSRRGSTYSESVAMSSGTETDPSRVSVKAEFGNEGFRPEDVPQQLPTPPPLQPMLKDANVRRTDPAPPKEYSSLFGQPLDTEEDLINAKLWRLALVLALVEAHWCSMGVNKRSGATAYGPSATSTAGVGGSVPAPIPAQATDMFSRILQNDALPDDLPPSIKADQEKLRAMQRAQREHDAKEEAARHDRRRDAQADKYLTHMSQDNRQMVRQLATFLVEEQSFTRAIEEALTGLPPNSSMKKLKMAFIKVAHEQLRVFCRTYGLTLDQFDSLFEDRPTLSFLKQAAVRLKILNETMAQYKDVGRENNSSLPDNANPAAKKGRYNLSLPSSLRDQHVNVSGEYEMDDSLSEAHTFFRELRGVPWTLRKMIGFIEKTVCIHQTCYERVYMQGQKKLLSNGGNLYITDGRLRKFTLLSPVPWSRPLAEFYRAWFAEPYFYLVHYYSETDRLTRVIHYQPYRLHFRISAERLDLATNDWQTVETREGFANLVRPFENFNADKWTAFPLS